jgi:hypothetical protein
MTTIPDAVTLAAHAGGGVVFVRADDNAVTIGRYDDMAPLSVTRDQARQLARVLVDALDRTEPMGAETEAALREACAGRGARRGDSRGRARATLSPDTTSTAPASVVPGQVLSPSVPFRSLNAPGPCARTPSCGMHEGAGSRVDRPPPCVVGRRGRPSWLSLTCRVLAELTRVHWRA